MHAGFEMGKFPGYSASVVKALRLKAGDQIAVRVEGSREFVVEREPTREELIASIRKMSRPLPPGFRFKRDGAV